MGKSSKAPPPPDFGPLIADIEAWSQGLVDRGDELSKWFNTEYQDLKTKGDSIFALQFQTAQDLYSWAQADRQFYEQNFQPLAEQYAKDVSEWDSAENLARVRGEAIADVSTAFDAEREARTRQLEGYGIDPSAARYQALDTGIRTSEALGKAFGANTAGRQRELEATALRGGAVQNIGLPMAGMASGQAGQAAGIGGAALQGQGGVTATGIAGQQAALPWYQAAGSGYGMIGDIKNQAYANQLAAWQAENQGGDPFSQALGLGASLFLGSTMPEIFATPWWVGGLTGGGGGGSSPNYNPQYINDYGYAEGGRVEGAEHGAFTGDQDGSETSDKIPAMLSENEFVIPADVVKRKGTEFFDKLIENTRGGGQGKGKSGGGFADGGSAQMPPGQILPSTPGPIAPLPSRVQLGSRPVASPALPAAQASMGGTMAPTVRVGEIDAALLALARKYGTPSQIGVLPTGTR